MHVEHVYIGLHTHMHVFSVNMPEREYYMPIQVCVRLICDGDATCQDTHAAYQ